MFDKFKKLLGGGEPPPDTTQANRARTGAPGARRPAKARPRSAAASGKFQPLESRGPMTGGGSAGGSSGGFTSGVDRSAGSRGATGGGIDRSAPFAGGVSGGFGPASGLGATGRGGRPGSSGSSGLSGPVPGAASMASRGDIAQVEVPCPNCGEPMLPGWGTTCGNCRPNLVAAKTMFLSDEQVALPAHAAGAMALGWLVVIRSPDEGQRATLIELDQDRVVLSRAGAAPSGSMRVVQFDDGYMSSAHAVIGRPTTGDRNDAFTIRDRDNPAPSVNGTFVNSQKLEPGDRVRLADGDVIKVGATELLFKSLWLPPVGMRAP